MISYQRLFVILGILFIYSTITWSAEIEENEINDEFVPYEKQRYDTFDWNLFKKLESSDLGNIIISPFSIKMVLAMLYEGASSATGRELEQVLNLPVSRQTTREKFEDIISSLQLHSKTSILNMGSRVFFDSSITPVQRFQTILKRYYDTEVRTVNFQNASEASTDINLWVKNLTEGRIEKLVDEGDLKNTVLLLANTIYFKGLWQKPFPRSNTVSVGFYLSPQERVIVPYMYNNARYYYTESSELDAQVLRLPFAGNGISMYILLPNSKNGLRNLIRDINSFVLTRTQWLMDKRQVNVYLPKFQFEFNSKLARILQQLGLLNIFQNTASLPGLSRKKLMVSNIIQKAGIEVNEEGSTVWAATDVTLENKLGVPDILFNASSPFLFYIEDEMTGTILFMGTVKNPAQVNQIPFPEELNSPKH